MAGRRVKDEGVFTKTIRVRLKDRHAKMLCEQAREVNFVWNYVNELSSRTIKEKGQFLSAYDIDKYTSGATKAGLSLHSQTVQAIQEEYVLRRRQFKKAKLRWRKGGGARRSLGWIPFKKAAISYKNGQLHYQGQALSVWDSYGLSQFEIRGGSFSEDSRGRWYANLVVEFKPEQTQGKASIGIDLGCKEAAVCSDGQRLAGRRFRELEAALDIAQRAGKKARAKAIHAKIKNRRNDEQHKFTTAIVKENAAIFVGDVSSLAMAKTRLAKSALDAGWGQIKRMLEYKSQWAGALFDVVKESFTTQACSRCHGISGSSPKGRAGLRIREWECELCGAVHDRDVNAALNILAAGHGRLAGGIPAL